MFCTLRYNLSFLPQPALASTSDCVVELVLVQLCWHMYSNVCFAFCFMPSIFMSIFMFYALNFFLLCEALCAAFSV